MRVNICKMIEVDTDVDVDLDELFSECFARVGDQDKGYVNRVVGAVATAVRLLQAVSDETIAEVKPGARKMVADAIAKEAARWAADTK